jgi:hypothetical protein
MRTLALLSLLFAAGCDDDSGAGAPDMASLTVGAFCQNGLGVRLGQCASGLNCCLVPCTNGPGDGGCVDLPSQCEPQPPPSGYRCH